MTNHIINNNIHVNMYDLFISLSNAADLVRPELINHHKQVAYLAFKLGRQLNLPIDQCKDLLLAGLLHDVGALSVNERMELLENEPPSTVNGHAYIGASLLATFPPLANIAKMIRYHHIPWEHGKGSYVQGNQVPLTSHVLHLADRVAVLINPNREVLHQVSRIHDSIKAKEETKFHPDVCSAFEVLCQQEYIWLDLTSRTLMDVLPNIVSFNTMSLDLDEVVQLAHVFAKIIDYRSPFTNNHSIGVAKVAQRLAQLAGFSKNECKMMLIAGYLHDLGKLAVHNDILEKPGALDKEDLNVIRSHTFYTYRLLQPIKGFETINQWAAFHHEKLNGTGYPFHLSDNEIPFGSRIMAVADIFTAITEDRPYRKGMQKPQVIDVLNNMVQKQEVSAIVVSLLRDDFDNINNIRKQAQMQESLEYNYFMHQSQTL